MFCRKEKLRQTEDKNTRKHTSERTLSQRDEAVFFIYFLGVNVAAQKTKERERR